MYSHYMLWVSDKCSATHNNVITVDMSIYNIITQYIIDAHFINIIIAHYRLSLYYIVYVYLHLSVDI